jgi:hypothetical protein
MTFSAIRALAAAYEGAESTLRTRLRGAQSALSSTFTELTPPH